MRGTQVVGALMLICGLVMFFNTSLLEIFTRLTDYTWGVILALQRLRFGSATASRKRCYYAAGVTADPLFAVHFMYDSVAAVGDALTSSGVKQLATGVPDFLRVKYPGRLRCAGGSHGALAGSSGERVDYLNAIVYAAFFRFIITGLARCFRQTDVKPVRLSRCVCRGCGRDVFRHRPPSLGWLT